MTTKNDEKIRDIINFWKEVIELDGAKIEIVPAHEWFIG